MFHLCIICWSWHIVIFEMFILPDGCLNCILRNRSPRICMFDDSNEFEVLNFSRKVYLRKENSSGSLSEGVLLAVGGRYDYLLHQLWSSDNVGYAYKFNCFHCHSHGLQLLYLFFSMHFSDSCEHAFRMLNIMYFYALIIM